MKNSIKIIILIIVLVTMSATFFLWRNKPSKPSPVTPSASTASPSEQPKIISTKPDPLENNIVSATDTIEVTFNRPLENQGEFKAKIEPKIDFKIQLSSDRKTAKIIPAKPYELGATYTLFIGPDTKFDGVGNWGQEKIFHFKTITYRGV